MLKSRELLGIVLDNKLKYDKHVENICHKASKTLNALAKVTNHSLNNKINQLHERCLRIIYNAKIQILRNC